MGSDAHVKMFKHCWPLAMQNSHLLNSSDIAVYMTPKPEKVKESVALIKDVFKGRNLKYHISENQGWQRGAMLAVKEGSNLGLFDGYEWVFRLNPDVIIQNDKWFLDTMKNDANASLFYVECLFEGIKPPQVRAMHTDFFALKPGALPKGHLGTILHRNAEMSFTRQMEPLIATNQHRHVPDVRPSRNHVCHVDGNLNGSVVHYHSKLRRRLIEASLCPATFF